MANFTRSETMKYENKLKLFAWKITKRFEIMQCSSCVFALDAFKSSLEAYVSY